MSLFICAEFLLPSSRQTAYCAVYTWENTTPTYSHCWKNRSNASYVSLPTMELVVPDNTTGHKTAIVLTDKVRLWPRKGGVDQMLRKDRGVSKNKASGVVLFIYSEVISWIFHQTSWLHSKLLIQHNMSDWVVFPSSSYYFTANWLQVFICLEEQSLRLNNKI